MHGCRDCCSLQGVPHSRQRSGKCGLLRGSHNLCVAGLYVLYDDGKNVRLLYELEVPLYPQVTLLTPFT